MASEMKIEIPTTLIEDTIRAELVRQIGGENKEKLITAVVQTAMGEKEKSYSNETYFQTAVNKMIRKEAEEIFRVWLDKNREEISKALFTYLNGNKQKRLKEFAEKIANNICSYGIHVNLNLREGE